MQGSAVVEVLDLAGAQAETNLNTPNLTNLGNTITADTVTGGQDNLLGALNLVAVKQPASGVLDNLAVVGLGDLLEEGGDLSLGWSALSGGLGLLLVSALSEQTRRDHQAQQELVGVVSSENKVGLAAGDNLLGRILLGNNKHVADNSTESINLSTQLDLDDLASLQGGLGLGGIGHQRGVGSHIGARRDGSRVGNTLRYESASLVFIYLPKEAALTLGDLLALVDLGDLLLEELVTLLADLDNLFTLDTES